MSPFFMSANSAPLSPMVVHLPSRTKSSGPSSPTSAVSVRAAPHEPVLNAVPWACAVPLRCAVPLAPVLPRPSNCSSPSTSTVYVVVLYLGMLAHHCFIDDVLPYPFPETL